MTEYLYRLKRSARYAIIDYLKKYGACTRKVLESYVLAKMSAITRRDGSIKHAILPVHELAFILAYKELENESQIQITRPRDVPSPATDFETTFATKNLEDPI